MTLLMTWKIKWTAFLCTGTSKKKKQDHFTKLIEECDESSAVLQVDFSENVSIVNQNEIQSSHWSHQQITIFTSHVWVNQNVKESFAIISDNLNHTKEAVYTFMSELLATINKKYSSIKLLNIFTDGTTSQSKQGFLFSNLHRWENELNFKIAWNFFGAINGIGGTVKPSVWRNVCTAIATPNNAIAYYELAKCLNMGIIITCISNDTITEKCAPRLPAWVNTLVVTNAMKLQCIKAWNLWQLEVAAFLRDETFKVENIFRVNVTDANDTELDLSLSDAEGNIGNDVLDPDQVIPANIIINITHWLDLSFVWG